MTLTALTVNNSGTITLEGVSGFTAATTVLDVSGVGTFNNTGSIAGIGTVVGTISGNAPSVGTSPGLVTITGDFIAESYSIFDAELEGEEAGIEYDQLNVLGTVTLQGSMNVISLKDYRPVSSTAYAVLTAGLLLGTFDEVNGLDFSQDEILDLNYTNNEVTLTVIKTTFSGTDFNDIINVNDAQNIVVAGDGDDLITSTGTADIIYGQNGDDVIAINTDFKRVDGGEGIDTLVFTESVNLADKAGSSIEHIEVISFANESTDVVELDSKSIMNIVDGENLLTGIDSSLVLLGNFGDDIMLAGDFLLSGTASLDAGRGEESFRIFTDGDATLFVSDEFSLQVTQIDGSLYVYESLVTDSLLADSLLEDNIDLSGVEDMTSSLTISPLEVSLNIVDIIDDNNFDLETGLVNLESYPNDISMDQDYFAGDLLFTADSAYAESGSIYTSVGEKLQIGLFGEPSTYESYL